MSAKAPSASEPARFPLFDGLRALAALSILVFHAALDTNAAVSERGLSPYLARLNVGVAVFFVISGFLLYRPMLAARARPGGAFGARKYFVRRVVRIVPAYWVALTLLSAWPGLPDVRTAHWWIYYGFGQGYSHVTASLGVGPAWTLGCEVVFYALLPVFSFCFSRAAAAVGRRLWPQLELAALACLSAASLAYAVNAIHDHATPQTTFAGTFGWFAAGMALALFSVLLNGRARWEAVASRWAWTGWVCALVAYLVSCRGLGLTNTGYGAAQTPVQAVSLYALSGVVALGLALPAAFERRPTTLVGRFLACRPLAWLGLVSYGIYLYHAPLLEPLNRITTGDPTPVRMLILVPLALCVTVFAAAISYYVVERPALEWGHRRRGAGRGAGRHEAPATQSP